MYPETDIPPIPITAEHLRRIDRMLPERPAALRARLERQHGLASEVVRQLVYSDAEETFEELTGKGHTASLVARLLTQELPAIPTAEAGSAPFAPSVRELDALLAAVEEGRIAKEGIPAVLVALATGPPDLEAAIERAGLSGFSSEELRALIERVVRSNAELVRRRGAEAFSPLMGDVMKEVRGRRDGREVSEELRQAIARLTSEAPG